jgi:GNAT superfamily N-acetyltransferase
MTEYRIEIDASPRPEDVSAVREGLARFNGPHIGEAQPETLAVFLRSGCGAPLGGLLGDMRLGWLRVNFLWIAEGHRHQGFGSRLLAVAEEEARRKGCRHAYLETLSFQARPFYERHGYTVFGELEDFPEGYTRYFMRKKLGGAA